MKNKKFIGICMIILLVLSSLPVTASSTEEINNYSMKVASLIEEKCHDDCENVLILGEDAVVPHYRRDIGMYSGMWWWKNLEREQILTDQLYTQTGDVYFADLDKLFNKKQDVTFVISASLKSDLHGKVDELKAKIQSKFASNVITVYESNVACNSFSLLDDATLIIIGDESNNAAVRCMPFLPKETSYISIERNVWDNEHYAIVLNPTEDIYDNLLALINIVDNGPDPDWTFGDTVVACLWDGKFGGSVPTAKEITCNLIPLVELAPDIRDSWRCLFANKDEDTDDGVINGFICAVVHFATGYDLATWGAAIFTAGATGAGGEIFDGGIAILKVSLKQALPNIIKSIGRKAARDALETIISAPKLLKGVIELIIKSPKLIPQMIEGSLQILRHGPEVTEACFGYIKNLDKFEWSADTLKGAGNVYDLKITKKYAIFVDGTGELTEAGLKFFGDDGVYKNILAARKGFETEFQKISVYVGEFEGAYANTFGVFIENSDKIILNAKRLADSKEYIRDFVIFHEHGHALRNIVTEGKLAPRLARLFPSDDSAKAVLEQFTEFDDTWRLYNFLDDDAAAIYKNALKTRVYGATFVDRANRLASGGYLNKEMIAKYLSEAEKFGFTEQYNILINAIDSKIGADSALKKYILELKDTFVKNAGHSNSAKYDQALKNVYNKLTNT